MDSLPALVLDQPRTLPTLESVRVDEPGPGEVRVRVIASGLCHTDLSAVRDARFWPVVLGHEGAGIVESLGANVTNVHVGDHVVVCWKTPCGRCRRCVMGRQDLCEKVQTTASPRVHRLDGTPLHVMLNAGTFCPQVVLPAEAAIPISSDMPLDKAALIGCAVATGVGAVLRTAKVQPGESVAVFGAGGVGLNVIQGARLAQAGMVVAVDRVASKIRLAQTLGATHTLNADEGDPVKRLLDLSHGRGLDHAFEVVGHPTVMDQALRALAPGGTLTFVGAAAREATFSLHPRAFLSQQQTMRGCIYGSCRPAVDLPLFVDWYLKGSLRLDALLTQTIMLEELPRQFETDPSPENIRTVVVFER